MEYDPKAIESKWQKFWLENATFKTIEDFSKPKYYVLDMFPYPSGAGLHVGHPEGYTATDIVARYKRMRGFNVLHPMGWDAFGLPAEQYALETGTHPRLTTVKNITRFREQIQALGLSYDWSREVDTTDPDYYKWTQWIFLQLYKKGLAYESREPVNWCPALGTVLANEEVIDGKSERGGYPVIKKPMRQWVLKITAYAERLIDDLDKVDWPDSIKEMQKHWIGKSTGADVVFAIENTSEKFSVFTTRVDTLFGVTFCVLAPEHPLIEKMQTLKPSDEVELYRTAASKKSEMERGAVSKVKTGVRTNFLAIHPVTGKSIPIFIADYVLGSYGHGAIMGVPAHDERDLEFAKKYDLEVLEVVRENKIVHSEFLNNLSVSDGQTKMIAWLEENCCGQKKITYKLRDWLFSRQRYWGEPFPVMHDEDGNVRLVAEKDLPVTLPEVEKYQPTGTGDSPLASAVSWREVTLDGKKYLRETNTMPNWAGSCWYYLRFIDPQNKLKPWDEKKEQYWLPVDLYVGGAEHAVLHLLYARFWHKVLFDCGLVSTVEPFKKLVNQGMILGTNGEKMSKSRGNVVNPDDVISEWGADSLRLYEMFMGPLEATKPWNSVAISGVNRFIKRVWRLIVNEEGQIVEFTENALPSIEKSLHQTIKKVTADIEHLSFNTAIAAMMEFTNICYKEGQLTKSQAAKIVLILSPFAPHVAEELWEKLGKGQTLAYAPWPEFDATLCAENSVTISVQVNGKLRGTLLIEVGASEDNITDLAHKLESVKKHLDGKIVKKKIYVTNKILNFVV